MAEIRINATGGLKLYDADDSHYAQIVAGTITSNVDAITLGHDTVTIADNLSLGSDSSVLKFGADGDTTLTHTDGTGLTLNSTNKICFNDASQFIQGSSNAVLSLGATDEIDLTATAVDLNGTLNVSGVATFQSTPVFPDGSLALADLDIDGGTDIGAAIVDADLFIVDDGAGGTNRKVTASRIKTYAGGASTLGALTDVTMDATNFTDSLLIQTNSDGSAPTTGTLSSANNNTGVGNAVFTDLTGGQQNSCFGNGTGENLTSGSNNTLVGHYAGNSITTGIMNVGIGKGSISGFDTEGSNIGIGENALGGSIAGGEQNVAIGGLVGDAVTSADKFTGLGYNAGSSVTTGHSNTACGAHSMGTTTTGQFNIIIGALSDTNGSGGDNQIVLGYNQTSLGDNNFSFGNGNTSRVYNDFGSNATFTRSSDERLKKDINTNEDCGLDFIKDLRTVTFKWRAPSEYDEDIPTRGDERSETEPKHKDKLYGFIAQEVKDVLDKYNITDFNGWHEAPDTKIQGVSYEMFVIPLVKSVQELSAQVTTLKDEINNLKGE